MAQVAATTNGTTNGHEENNLKEPLLDRGGNLAPGVVKPKLLDHSADPCQAFYNDGEVKPKVARGKAKAKAKLKAKHTQMSIMYGADEFAEMYDKHPDETINAAQAEEPDARAEKLKDQKAKDDRAYEVALIWLQGGLLSTI